MKRRIKHPKLKTSKRPLNQKTIDNYFILSQTKTKTKTDNDQKSLDIDDQTDKENEKENIPKTQINFIKKPNSFNIMNKELFSQQFNKITIEKEEEIIFPIMLDTSLGIYKELLSSKIQDILNKVNNDSKWVEVTPIISQDIIKLKIKDPENETNCIILGFITKALSEKLISLSLIKIIWIKIFLHKNGRRLSILIGLNYIKYEKKVIFIDEQKKRYKLQFKSIFELGDEIDKMLKELKNKYNPGEIYKNDFLYLIYNRLSMYNESNYLDEIEKEILDDNNENEENESEYENDSENKRILDYLVNNIDKILSLCTNYDNLFGKNDKSYYNIFINLNEEEKNVLLNFLKRKHKWQNIDKFFNNENKYSNKGIKEHLNEIIKSLLEKKLISDFSEIIGNFQNLNNDKFFEFLHYLPITDLKKIISDLNKIHKNTNIIKEDKENILSPHVKNCFINNPFYNLDLFISPHYKNDKRGIREKIKNNSEKITKFNFTINKTKSKKEIAFHQKLLIKNSYNTAYNDKSPKDKYVNSFSIFSNYKYILFINDCIIDDKIPFINTIINEINKYKTEDDSSFIENYIPDNNGNNGNNFKEKKLEQIFFNYTKTFFCINENLARIIDTCIRLFFFYDDFIYLNNKGEEFNQNERYENYKFNKKVKKNMIFKEKSLFHVYDILYQIKESYLTFSKFKYNYEKYPNFLYRLFYPLINFLLKLTNYSLYYEILTKQFNIFSLQEFKNDNLNEQLINQLIKKLESFSDLNNENIVFHTTNYLHKYKPEYISAEILYYFAKILEKNKYFKKANLIYLFLLNCFDNSFIFDQRGCIYHSIILNFNTHLKDDKSTIEILNICIQYEIMKYKSIKRQDLIKIKKYYDKFNNLKNNPKNITNIETINLLIPYSFEEINDNCDITKFLKVIKYNLLKSNFSAIKSDEELVLNYYIKNGNFKGISGRNNIIPSLYCLLFWEEIFDGEIPLVFQSKYQAFPLDFFEKDFYLNRKTKLDKRIEKINNYKKEEFIEQITSIYESKNGIKNPCIKWNSNIYNKDLLIKIAIAFGSEKLVDIFKNILIHGLKNVKSGFPDFYLWKENDNLENEANFNYVENNSIKLITIIKIIDKLSDEQKLWLKFFGENNFKIEILQIK